MGDCMKCLREVLLAIALAVTAVGGTAAQGIRPGFHSIDSFSGSSMGDDAEIWSKRIQGIGSVYVSGGNPAVELVLRRNPSPTAAVVAYLGSVEESDGLHSIYAANEPGLIGELECVANGQFGLVADLGGWARAVYGYTRSGQVRRGWVRLAPGSVEYKSYDDQILQHLTWFERPESVELFDRPNGQRIVFLLGPPAGGRETTRSKCSR